MHSFETKSGRYYMHNEDFSGDIFFTDPVTDTLVSIPFSDMVELVSEYEKSKKIEAIEQEN